MIIRLFAFNTTGLYSEPGKGHRSSIEFTAIMLLNTKRLIQYNS